MRLPAASNLPAGSPTIARKLSPKCAGGEPGLDGGPGEVFCVEALAAGALFAAV